MSQTTFIYALCEPGTGEIRYIGKADNPRKRFLAVDRRATELRGEKAKLNFSNE